MSLLDVIRGIPERMGRGMERNIGGLLGIDPEDMTEEERRQARRLSQMAVFDAMARGTSPIAGLRQAAELLGAQRAEREQRREAEQRMGAAQQASSQIAGRLLGGAPIPTAPGAAAGDELTGVNVQSQYRRDPMDALRMSMTPGGMDAMQLSPQLGNLLTQNVGQQVVGGAIYDRATGQFMRPPEEPKPVTRIGSEDLGDRVVTYFSDGSSQVQSKGVAPSARVAGQPDLSKDERDRVYKARDTIRASDEILSGLDSALALSDRAFEGPLAGTRAMAATALPDIIEPEGAKATIEFDALLKQQVLPQLKTVFGGNPTEGERKILLDLQGSSSMPRAVRNNIIRRAIEAARRRSQAAAEEVQQLLGGTYFDLPPAEATPAPQAPSYIFSNGRLVPSSRGQ